MNRDVEQLQRVTALVMVVLEGYGTREHLAELERIGISCGPDCALGSVPACTCGSKEAANFSKLMNGRINGRSLVR